jgi:hypothetical protein
MFEVPATFWRNGWLHAMSGAELGVYLLLTSTIRKEPRRRRPPRVGRYIPDTALDLLGLSAPTVRKAIDGLKRAGIVHVVYKPSAQSTDRWLLLTDPDLTSRPSPP